MITVFVTLSNGRSLNVLWQKRVQDVASICVQVCATTLNNIMSILVDESGRLRLWAPLGPPAEREDLRMHPVCSARTL